MHGAPLEPVHCVLQVSTVGYGDVSPGTWQGQLFVCAVILSGLIFLAMPLAIVGNGATHTMLRCPCIQCAFSAPPHTQAAAPPVLQVGNTFGEVWQERETFKLQRHMRQLLAENGVEPDDAVAAFKKMDETIRQDGLISFDESNTEPHTHDAPLPRAFGAQRTAAQATASRACYR